jgi:P-type conjugative transfer protein TrbJ
MKIKAIAIFFLCLAARAHAQVPVIDAGVLGQSIQNTVTTLSSYSEQLTQYAKQVQQYKTQLDQYRTQLENLKQLGQFNWSDPSKTLDNFIGTVGQIGQANATYDKFLQDYKSVPAWNQTLQTTGSGTGSGTPASTAQRAAVVQETTAKASTTEIAAYAATAKNLSTQQAGMTQDAANLKKMVDSAQTATGQLQALQAGSQLASEQINQLMEMRQLLINLNDITVARNASLANREAAEAATTKRGLSEPFGKTKFPPLNLKLNR